MLVRNGRVAVGAALGTAVFLAACGSSSDHDDDGSGARGGTGAGGQGAAGQGALAGKAGTAGTAGLAGGDGSSGIASGGSATAGTAGSATAGGGGQSGRGGAAGTSGSGATSGKDGTGGDEGGAGGASACSELQQRTFSPRARSVGFSGTMEAYDALYDVDCNVEADCATPCLASGGSAEMCAAGECVMSISNYCLPAPVWLNLGALDTPGSEPSADGAELVLVADTFTDTLLLDDFGFDIPDDAEVLGFTVTVRHAGGGMDEAVDDSIRLLKAGNAGTTNRASSVAWNAPDFANVDYGNSRDKWGETWTPADVNDEGFGVALSAKFGQTAGNGRAYVDIVYVEVSYRTCP